MRKNFHWNFRVLFSRLHLEKSNGWLCRVSCLPQNEHWIAVVSAMEWNVESRCDTILILCQSFRVRSLADEASITWRAYELVNYSTFGFSLATKLFLTIFLGNFYLRVTSCFACPRERLIGYKKTHALESRESSNLNFIGTSAPILSLICISCRAFLLLRINICL